MPVRASAKVVGKICLIVPSEKGAQSYPGDRRWHDLHNLSITQLRENMNFNAIVIRTSGGKARMRHAALNDELMINDVIITGPKHSVSLEYLIGGRTALTASTLVVISGERDVTGDKQSIRRLAGDAFWLWFTGDPKIGNADIEHHDHFFSKPPLEIQTSGGIIGIKG